MEGWNELKNRTPWYILESKKEKTDKWNLGITNQDLFPKDGGNKDPYKDGIKYWWK